jgi:uncharacterized membrane protein YdfJ with MMPL/SSD domain
VLLLPAAPVRSLHLGQTDKGALPKDTQSRQSYDTMTEGFGPGSNGPMLIAVNLSKPTHNDQADLDKLRNQQRKTTQQEIAKQQAKAEKKIREQADQAKQQAEPREQEVIDKLAQQEIEKQNKTIEQQAQQEIDKQNKATEQQAK